jgi:hypothetical protein
MEERVLRDFEALRVAWKFEWESLLRKEPATNALGHPDTLVFKMDETINALLELLRRDRSFRAHPKSLLMPLDRHCACRLNPLSKFYATGEVALRSVARSLPPAELENALVRLRLFGLDEIESLCGVCQNRLRDGFSAGSPTDWAARCGAYRG